jgi:hypothetical protein
MFKDIADERVQLLTNRLTETESQLEGAVSKSQVIVG